MIHLITGGIRSGKSGYGEKLLNNSSNILYLATAKVTDEEMEERVRKHQERRGSAYHTIEGYKNLVQLLEPNLEKDLMFECVGTMLSNLMFDRIEDFENITSQERQDVEDYMMKEINSVIDYLETRDGMFIIISNEVGWTLVSEYASGRLFSDVLGRVNQYIASRADKVSVLISGLPLTVK